MSADPAMLTEQCAMCDATVSFDDTVHVLLNTKTDVGVLDYYVCTDCYDADLAPLFPDPPDDEPDADASDDSDRGADDDDHDDTDDDDGEGATDAGTAPVEN